ncbi:transcription factor GTE4 [Humulus lupulus]|uniref:transcription factor GTE4 n=1 Tax=Humulus lupulus TaxID=3486 RepID=UPI002B40E0C3|nr:transcription factor GTE4 [Humulus lupulus]
MASGPTVEGGDGARETQRYTESKVYRRKSFKGLKKNIITGINNTAIASTNDNDNAKAKGDTNTTTTVLVPEPESGTTTATADNVIKDNDNNNKSNDGNEDGNKNTNDNDNEGKKDNEGETDNESKKDNEGKTDNECNNNENSTQPPPQALELEDGNLSQHLLSRLDAVSDDSSSLNRQPVVTDVIPNSRDPPGGNGPVKEGLESRVTVSLASQSKQGADEIRRKLESELETVRNWVKKIEQKQGQISGYTHLHVSANERVSNGGAKRSHSEVASVGVTREAIRPLHQLNISVLENNQGVNDIVEKEKRTPKANQFYRNSEFLLAKDKFPPAESNKKSKLNGKKQGGDLGNGFGMGTKFFKSCTSLLDKLMKHKHGWVFNEPVDVAGLGLHDYHTIIKQPMDLGTIKSRLSKNWYKSPKEFAEDVRLTFRNAMTYNPPGQDVHIMADQLSKIFEERWMIIESDYNREMRFGFDYGVGLPTPTPRKVPPSLPSPLDMRRILDRSESMTHYGDPRPKPMSITPTARTPALKKPKAKDPHKRDMTYDEKQKLSTNLQSLPSEKLDAIVQIIKKRNSSLFQDDDEIEVDIDSVDAETLWELDRFVTNYKKSLSKNKRKAELASQARAEAMQNVQLKSQVQIVAEVPKENKTDENIVSSSPPAQGDNQGDNRSRSSSSSSSSSSGSSSSDSDSESSSASGSDAGSPRT